MGANAESYDFTFATAACGTSAGTNPPASAVLVRYTGVDPANPIDKEQGAAGTGTAPVAPAVTVTNGNDRILRFFGSATEPRRPAPQLSSPGPAPRPRPPPTRTRRPPPPRAATGTAAAAERQRPLGRRDDYALHPSLDHGRAAREPIRLRLHPCHGDRAGARGGHDLRTGRDLEPVDRSAPPAR